MPSFDWRKYRLTHEDRGEIERLEAEGKIVTEYATFTPEQLDYLRERVNIEVRRDLAEREDE